MSTAQSLASKRIDSLLDANSFVEIGGYVTARNTDFNLSEKETPADGVITGYGVIDGSLVYVYSQDASVLNGSIGEMHAKKIAKLYDLAMKADHKLTEEEQIRTLKTRMRILTWVLVAAVAVIVALTIPAVRYLLEETISLLPGQNYSVAGC